MKSQMSWSGTTTKCITGNTFGVYSLVVSVFISDNFAPRVHGSTELCLVDIYIMDEMLTRTPFSLINYNL